MFQRARPAGDSQFLRRAIRANLQMQTPDQSPTALQRKVSRLAARTDLPRVIRPPKAPPAFPGDWRRQQSAATAAWARTREVGMAPAMAEQVPRNGRGSGAGTGMGSGSEPMPKHRQRGGRRSGVEEHFPESRSLKGIQYTTGMKVCRVSIVLPALRTPTVSPLLSPPRAAAAGLPDFGVFANEARLHPVYVSTCPNSPRAVRPP